MSLSGTFKVALTTMTVGMALGLIGCSGSGNEGSPERVVTDFSSCDQKPDVGISAISNNSQKTEFVISKFFDKPYDRYDLEAVLDASSVSTTDYVRSLGIGVYKVPRSNMAKQCPTYFNLPTATGDFAKIWKQAAGGNTGTGKLAGLFFEYCGVGGAACRDRSMVNPTILVDEASDRWTLVHEMMHYNFNQSRKGVATIETAANLEKQAKFYAGEFQKAMDDFDKIPDRNDLAKATTALGKLINVGKEIYVRRSLEEMSIEGMLIHLWANGELRNVSANAPTSGVWYMNFSRDRFLESLPPFDTAVEEIGKRASAGFWPEIIADVDAIKANLEASRTETAEMIKTAKKEIKSVQEAFDDDTLARTSASLITGKNEPDFNSVLDSKSAEQAAREHMASHDHDGLEKTFNAIVKKIAARNSR